MKMTSRGLRSFLPSLPEDAKVLRNALDESGIEVKNLNVSPDDGIEVTLEFLANRGDHRCYYGVARELSARLALPLSELTVEPLTVASGGPAAAVMSGLCLAYTLTPLEVLDGVATIPADSAARLAAAGFSAGHPVVDAAEAAGLELGQPVRAYDADRVAGAIEVRVSRTGESFRPAGAHATCTLPEGTLVVADEEKILSVAGVAISEVAGVSADTERVLLESAAYDPVAVRLAAAALGISNAMSQRFERGCDPTAPQIGAGRALHLLSECGAAKRNGPTSEPRRWEGSLPVLPLDAAEVSDFIGTEFTPADIADRLGSYGFRAADGGFEVPGTRIWDVREPEDLYEELARHAGFDQLPEVPLPVGVGVAPTAEETLVRSIGDTLVSLGFYETFTEGFYGKDALKILSPADGHPLSQHIGIANAEDRRYSMLKNNCLAQAVGAVSSNLRFKQERVFLFEATRVFEPARDADNGICRERPVVWAIASGDVQEGLWSQKPSAVDFFFIRGVAEEVAVRCGLELAVERLPTSHPLADFLHPYRSALLEIDGRPVGVCGEVHPDVRHRAELGAKRPVYLELDLAGWTVADDRVVGSGFREDPAVERMLDFVLPQEVSSGEVLSVLRESTPAWVRSVNVADVYLPAPDDPGYRSITYLLRLDSEPARAAEDFNRLLASLTAMVTERFAAAGVHLRT